MDVFIPFPTIVLLVIYVIRSQKRVIQIYVHDSFSNFALDSVPISHSMSFLVRSIIIYNSDSFMVKYNCIYFVVSKHQIDRIDLWLKLASHQKRISQTWSLFYATWKYSFYGNRRNNDERTFQISIYKLKAFNRNRIEKISLKEL